MASPSRRPSHGYRLPRFLSSFCVCVCVCLSTPLTMLAWCQGPYYLHIREPHEPPSERARWRAADGRLGEQAGGTATPASLLVAVPPPAATC